MSNAGFIIGSKNTKYGLTLNSKTKKPQAKTKSLGPARPLAAFADPDDDEEQEQDHRGAAELRRQQDAYRVDKKVQAAHAAAIAEDPTIFDYDGVYDSLKEGDKVKLQVQEEKEVRQSKYIGGLITKKKTRDVEQNIIYEKNLLKERKKEDHLYGDKERFVTSAYKKKLEEEARWTAEEKLRLLKEEEEEVTKRKDLSHFYSNLLKTNAAYGNPASADKEDAAASKAASKPTARADDKAADKDAVTSSRADVASNGEESEDRAAEPTSPSPTSGELDPAAELPRPTTIPVGPVLTGVETRISAASTAEKPNPEQAKRSREETVQSARERYLARKRQAKGA
ncbi:hypothetical protein CYMTET_9179 [Cymbomonas tetramitiformis]|uniref:Nuclear speckle splicing regulatory protein 1 N-terminal domain-containing protein n=1 Tax=Cymbomonas tetramitiformis TaxID=36881 RepID=A0AAE0LFR4_9CHLO|nr:hypothetical protein CYMTET_9179 [Cymbomonas tetramitiformis]